MSKIKDAKRSILQIMPADGWVAVFLIPSDFVVHSFRPPMEEAMSRLWSQLG